MAYWGLFLHQLTRNLVFVADGESGDLSRPRGVADHINSLGSDKERTIPRGTDRTPEAPMPFEVEIHEGEGDGILHSRSIARDRPKKKTAEFYILAAFPERVWERCRPPDDTSRRSSRGVSSLSRSSGRNSTRRMARPPGGTAPAQPSKRDRPAMSAPPVPYSATASDYRFRVGQTGFNRRPPHHASDGGSVPRSFKRCRGRGSGEERVADLLALHGEKRSRTNSHPQTRPEIRIKGTTVASSAPRSASEPVSRLVIYRSDKDGREWFYRSYTTGARSSRWVELGGSAAPCSTMPSRSKETISDEKQQSLFLDQKRDEALAKFATWERSRKVRIHPRGVGAHGDEPV